MEAVRAADQPSLGAFVRDQRRAAQLSLRELATAAGISTAYLSQIERDQRRPSAEILHHVARALDVAAEALFVRAGILDELDEADVVRAVQRTDALTDEQKRVLLRVYEAFVRENRDARRTDAVVVPARLAGPSRG
jgi:transcriptional regulator with XRE-family HTH domain